MAITLSGSPQDLTAGYNPVYFYASSDNVNEPNFRYLVDVINADTSETLANLKIKPRYGDNLLEVNISKILDTNLGSFADDIDFNGSVTGFTNAPSCGFNYTVSIGEEYPAIWNFGDVIFNSGMVRLTGNTDSGYQAGDQIIVEGAAEPFVFTDNQFDSGAVAFLVPTGHTIQIGDTITVFQNPGYTFEQYNGEHTVTNVTATLITTSTPFAGNTPVEGGTLWRNYAYDGVELVLSAGTLSPGIYFVDYDQAWIDNSPTHGGTTRYYDGRLEQFTGLTEVTKSVFNGAIGHNDWINWNSDNYYPSGDTTPFLTTLPNPWDVRLENDAFLNFWDDGVVLGSIWLRVSTYDSTDTLINTYNLIDAEPFVNTEIVNSSVGPRSLNVTYPNIIENGTFATTSGWAITNQLGGVATITGGTLNYLDTAGGNGTSLIRQTGLTIGCSYEVTLTTSNNNFVVGNVGDNANTYNIFTQGDNGTYSVTFTAASEVFVIELNSAGGVTQGVDVDDVVVRQLCPVIDCDVAYYTVQVISAVDTPQTEEFRFNVDCDCNGRYTNYPMLFQDRMGSHVPFNFELMNRQRVNVENRDTTKRFIGNGGQNAYTYSTAEHSHRQYNIDIVEEWELNTDFLTETEAAYLEELLTSPVVHMLVNGQYVAVNVVDTTYERLRKINQKNIRYTVRVQLSNNNTIQTG